MTPPPNPILPFTFDLISANMDSTWAGNTSASSSFSHRTNLVILSASYANAAMPNVILNKGVSAVISPSCILKCWDNYNNPSVYFEREYFGIFYALAPYGPIDNTVMLTNGRWQRRVDANHGNNVLRQAIGPTGYGGWDTMHVTRNGAQVYFLE